MKDLLQRAEIWLAGRPNAHYLMASALLFLGGVALGGWVERLSGGLFLGLTAALFVRFLLHRKLTILAEPLRLSTNAVRQRLNGRPIVQVRAILGRGRQMTLTGVEAWVQRTGEPERGVEVHWLPQVIVGPCTLSLAIPESQGVLKLRVCGLEGDQEHERRGQWVLESISSGVFTSPCDWRNGRLCGSTTLWDKVRSCGSSSPPSP
jgi:hypothetical protein